MPCLRLFFLVLLSQLTQSQYQSPCPNVFSYEPRNSEENIWYGVVNLRSDDELIGIFIRIILDEEAELLGNWFGSTTTSDNREYLIRKENHRLDPSSTLPVRFFVRYTSTVPRVKTILLNGKKICPERRQVETVTQLHISEKQPAQSLVGGGGGRPSRPTAFQGNSGENVNNYNNNYESSSSSSSNSNNRRPDYESSNSRHPSNNNNNRETLISSLGGSTSGLSGSSHSTSHENDFFPGDFVVAQPMRTTVRPRPAKKYSCGTVSPRATPLITHGTNASDGQWPWHAALYHSQGVQLTYICGGSLLSEYFVVTAAHCVVRQSTSTPVNPQSLVVYLGKSNLKKFGAETQTLDVSKVVVHPNYNHTVFHNDIALLKFNRAVEFTDFVRPVCLWSGSTDLSAIHDKQGTVVGWGFDEFGQLSNVLTQAQMPVVASTKCIYSNPDFFSRFTFDKSYCAGFRNGTTVCNGDSGGGMVFSRRNNENQDVWQIRGLVSVGVALQRSTMCDPSHYTVFTDVAKHLDWVRMILSSA